MSVTVCCVPPASHRPRTATRCGAARGERRRARRQGAGQLLRGRRGPLGRPLFPPRSPQPSPPPRGASRATSPPLSRSPAAACPSPRPFLLPLPPTRRLLLLLPGWSRPRLWPTPTSNLASQSPCQLPPSTLLPSSTRSRVLCSMKLCPLLHPLPCPHSLPAISPLWHNPHYPTHLLLWGLSLWEQHPLLLQAIYPLLWPLHLLPWELVCRHHL